MLRRSTRSHASPAGHPYAVTGSHAIEQKEMAPAVPIRAQVSPVGHSLLVSHAVRHTGVALTSRMHCWPAGHSGAEGSQGTCSTMPALASLGGVASTGASASIVIEAST